MQSKSFCCSLPLQCVTEFNRHMKVDMVKHLSARLKVCDLGLKLSLWLITFATYRRNDLYRNSFSLSCTFKRREWPSHTYRESPDNSVVSQQPGCYKRRRCSIRWVFRAHWKDRRQLLLFLVWCRTEGKFYISSVIHWLAKKKPRSDFETRPFNRDQSNFFVPIQVPVQIRRYLEIWRRAIRSECLVPLACEANN